MSTEEQTVEAQPFDVAKLSPEEFRARVYERRGSLTLLYLAMREMAERLYALEKREQERAAKERA